MVAADTTGWPGLLSIVHPGYGSTMQMEIKNEKNQCAGECRNEFDWMSTMAGSSPLSESSKINSGSDAVARVTES
jgi:hypothetical protein